MTYKYFCNECGHHFTSNKPERDENGFLNDISCPECGGWNVYPDTDAGAAASVKEQTEYENEIYEVAEE